MTGHKRILHDLIMRANFPVEQRDELMNEVANLFGVDVDNDAPLLLDTEVAQKQLKERSAAEALANPDKTSADRPLTSDEQNAMMEALKQFRSAKTATAN